MNQDRIEGNWKQFKGKIKEQWGKLTDDDMDVFEGRREQLLGRIQERHGITSEQAEIQVKDWEKRTLTFSSKSPEPALFSSAAQNKTQLFTGSKNENSLF